MEFNHATRKENKKSVITKTSSWKYLDPKYQPTVRVVAIVTIILIPMLICELAAFNSILSLILAKFLVDNNYLLF